MSYVSSWLRKYYIWSGQNQFLHKKLESFWYNSAPVTWVSYKKFLTVNLQNLYYDSIMPWIRLFTINMNKLPLLQVNSCFLKNCFSSSIVLKCDKLNLITSRSEKVTKSRRKLLELTCVSGNIVFNFHDTKGIQLLTRSRWHWAISMSINSGLVFKILLYIFAAWGVTFHSLLVNRWNSLFARYSL